MRGNNIKGWTKGSDSGTVQFQSDKIVGNPEFNSSSWNIIMRNFSKPNGHTKLNVEAMTMASSSYLKATNGDGGSSIGSVRFETVGGGGGKVAILSFNISAIGSLSVLGVTSNGPRIEIYRIWTS